MNPLTKRKEEALRLVLENKYSAFYREHYATILPKPHHWHDIPFLTREAIMRVPLAKRTFIPADAVDSIGMTSGTSGRGLLLIPRDREAPRPTFDTARFLGKEKTIMWFNPFGYVFRTHLEPTQQLIAGDRAHLEESARLCGAWSVEGLIGAPSILIAFAPYLTKHTEVHTIRRICISTERCSTSQLKELQRLYPGATLAVAYSSVEAGYVACSPLHPINNHPLALITSPEFFAECIDGAGKEVEPGGEGELVLTSFARKAFPLIRYRTGDKIFLLGQIEENLLFEVRGRMSEEGVRIPGGEILLIELERALATLPAHISDYEATLTEIGTPSRILLSITLFVSETPRESVGGLAMQLSRELRVNGQRTYEDGVVHGIYAPLLCTAESYRIEHGRKRRHLTDLRG